MFDPSDHRDVGCKLIYDTNIATPDGNQSTGTHLQNRERRLFLITKLNLVKGKQILLFLLTSASAFDALN